MVIEARPMLELSARICCAGLLIQSLELIRHWRHLRDDGVLGWQVPTAALRNPLVRVVRRGHRYPHCLAVLGARALAAAAVLLLPGQSPASFWTLGGLLVVQLYFNRRFSLVQENANAMYLACLAAVVVGLLPGGSERLALGAAAFLAFQVALAYFAAGLVKLRSAAWRNGSYLAGVIHERRARAPALQALLQRHRSSAIIASGCVIALETLFPLAVFLPDGLFWIFLAGGVVFHATVTWLMGVHSFWWSFLAGYPALCLIHARLRSEG